MTYSTSIAPNFTSIAQDLAAAWKQPTVSGGSALIPAEANARQQREGSSFLRSPAPNGATVDQEGLTNNYGVEPEMYYASLPSPEQVRQYTLQGFAAATFLVGLILTSLVVS